MITDNREHIILNENAYFYKKKTQNSLSKKLITDTFKIASAERKGNYLLKIIKETITFGVQIIPYSICVFKFEKTPSFIQEDILGWEETKLAYFLIVEIGDYVVISKKNISGINSFLKKLTPLDYNILSNLFINSGTTFEKFTLQNMNISNSSVRTKSISSTDLKDNFSPLGANSYVLKNLRLNTSAEKITLALNTSRINKFGQKNGIKEFIFWSLNIKNKIASHTPSESFISIFAEPHSYEDEIKLLTPIAILLDTNQLFDDIESGKIEKGIIKIGDLEREINLVQYLEVFNRLAQVNTEIQNGVTHHKIENSIAKDFYINKNSKSITLSSRKLSKLILVLGNGSQKPILNYINQHNDFIINFDKLEFIYTKRKLFKDSKLLGNIDYFMKIFIPYTPILSTTTEKGNVSSSSTNFPSNSVFDFVEKTFSPKFDYFICDDLSKEWADHIGINEDTISFFHSKWKKANFSASAFQDIIGQAQKNFGNLTPSNKLLDWKGEDVWSKIYRGDTNITKLRKGSNIPNAISQWKETQLNPNLKREVFIVINFISKAGLELRLKKLKNGEDFGQKKEVIQILWFISSLISSSQELGIDTYICCKP